MCKLYKRVGKPVDFFLKYGMLFMCAERNSGYTMRFFFAKDEKVYHFLGKCRKYVDMLSGGHVSIFII